MKEGSSSGTPQIARAIENMRQSEERFYQLVEGVTDYAIFMLDSEGNVATWNAGAERIKGYRAEEIIGHHFSEFYPQEAIDRGFPQYELRMASAEGRFEDEGWRLRKDGSPFWANVVITALRDDNGVLYGFLKITRDLTERRRHEEELRHSEERFRLLVEGVTDYAIFMLDPEGNVATWNAGAERIKGYRAEDIIGHHFSQFYPQEAIDRGFPQYELKMARAEGRFEDEGWRLRKDGSRFWANVIITPVYDQTGRLHGYAKVTRDMTAQKRIIDLELAGRRMKEFLAMLSHELRNPLAPIRNAVYLMQLMKVEDPELQWARDVIDRQVSHLSRLVDDLLEVSRVISGNIRLQRERVEVGIIIARAIESVRPLIESRRHRLEVAIPGESMEVDGDMVRLTQVFVNLLNNAAKYTPEGGRIDVEVEKRPGNVLIRVRDTGAGMPSEMLTTVFDLFAQGERTLDRSEGGLGIGLTLVRQLIEMHGGIVDALSKGPGEGSEFVVELPLAAAASRTGTGGDEREGASPNDSPGVRVLVVDDNVDAVTGMGIFLRTWGYDVRIAYDGIEALKIAQVYRPDIALLDIGLPGMDGYELADRLRQLPGEVRCTLSR
jgi:PAS domain S-box-containing protein